jgi:hypothetical protein
VLFCCTELTYVMSGSGGSTSSISSKCACCPAVLHSSIRQQCTLESFLLSWLIVATRPLKVPLSGGKALSQLDSTILPFDLIFPNIIYRYISTI